jgi:hypothetical protein
MRWRAERFIACMKTMKPGTTTEAEARQQLRSFHVLKGFDLRADEPFYAFGTDAIALNFIARIMPYRWDSVAERVPLPKYTWMGVTLRYRNGLVSKIHASESQLPVLFIAGHATSIASVTAFSQPEMQDCEYTERRGTRRQGVPPDFAGYLVNQNDVDGIVTKQWVTLDERASDVERLSAFDFRGQCIASLSGCLTAAELRPGIEASHAKSLDQVDMVFCR